MSQRSRPRQPLHRRLLRWFQHEMPRPRLRLRWDARRARRGAERRVLLVGENALMWQYLDDYRCLFERDARLRFFASPAHEGTKAEASRSLAAERNIPFLSRSAGTRRWWDLAVFANHGAAHRYAAQVPKLRIQHALSDGKRFFGRTFRYDPHLVLRAGGRSIYDLIFEASLERQEHFERLRPALRGVIRVVGDLRADALLDLVAERESIRARMGFSAATQVVVLCSTWGEGSLVEQMGPALVREAQALAARSETRFLLSVHPHVRRDPGRARWLRQVASASVRVLGPHEDPAAAFVAADAIVVDHTSLIALFSLLVQPIVCVPVPSAVLAEDSTLARLRALGTPLAEPEGLEAALHEARASCPVEELRALARTIDAYPGEAADRMRASTYELLRLPAPQVTALGSDPSAVV